MPRQLPPYEQLQFSEANFERIQVLKNTIELLNTEAQRKAAHEQAKQNHAEWAKTAQSATAKVSVERGDWGEVTAAHAKKTGTIYAVLNMANAYTPGGGYLDGCVAQEENMYRRTDCHFHILDTHFHKGQKWDDTYTAEMTQLINGEQGKVYLDTKEPRVCIKKKEHERNQGKGYELMSTDEFFEFYELRAAADDLRPNKPYNENSMRKKIAAQLDTLKDAGLRHVVLSAFGCGAFGNPAEQVAKLYREELEKRPGCFDEVIFAIYYPGYGTDNFPPFQKVLDGLALGPKPNEADKPEPLIQNDRKIVSVDTSDCWQDGICKHIVTIKYEDGGQERAELKGTEIWQRFKDYLKPDMVQHFRRIAETVRTIVSVDISALCGESLPCQHKVTIKYEDGSQDHLTLNGEAIWERFKDYLKPAEVQHFATYEHPAQNRNTSNATPPKASSKAKIGMQVVAGFALALGTLALALAFLVLGAALANPLGIAIAAVGGVFTATGIGFFAASALNKKKTEQPEQRVAAQLC